MTEAAAPAKKHRGNGLLTTGTILTFGGLAFAFFPVLIAFAGTQPGHNMFSEGDSGSAGAALWLMIITLPLGGAAAFGGLIALSAGVVQAMRDALPDETVAELAEERGTLLARRARILGFLVLPALLATHLVISFVIGGMIVGGAAGQVVNLIWAAAEAAVAWMSMRYAIRSGHRTLKAIMAGTTALAVALAALATITMASFFSGR